MRYRIILILAIMLLFVGSAAAAFETSEFTRSPVVTVSTLKGQYMNACATFTWKKGLGTAADFNNYVVRLTSNNTEFNKDVNTINSWYSVCTITPGEWVKAVVYRVDGNAEGYFLNSEPDVNVTVFPGNVAQAGTYMFYNILVAIGGLAALVVTVIVISIFLKRMGIKIFNR